MQFLDSQISYGDGLKSSAFWQEYREQGNLASSIIYILIALAASFAVSIRPEPILRVSLVLLLVSLLASVIFGLKNKLRLFQLNRQLKIIKAAQQEQEK